MMIEANVNLNEAQIEELIQNVNIFDYVDYQPMEDWDDYMNTSGATAIEIIDSIDKEHFDTSDKFAVIDGTGYWVSTNSLEEILEPFIDDMLQDYLDSTLQ